MNSSYFRLGVQLFCLTLGCTWLSARDLFVATNGTPEGPGTMAKPYDLATALSGQVGKPGDTFWLRGGDYKLGHVDTKIHGSAGRPVTFREFNGEAARIDGTITIFDSIGYVVFRDFELYSSDIHRVSAQTNVGFNVTDIAIIPGMASYAPNVSFINLVVHDHTRHGIFLSHESTNDLVYGCIVFNNGWASPDNAEGHGLYVQGVGGTRTLKDNIVFNNSGANMHVYENTNNAPLVGVVLDGNVAFNAGAIQHVRPYRDWIVGVDAPGAYADKIVLKNNMGYEGHDLVDFAEMQIGRDQTNGMVTMTGNYLPLGLEMNNWRKSIVQANLFGPVASNYIVTLKQTFAPLRGSWSGNSYFQDPTGGQFLLNTQSYSFSAWRAATHVDSNSKFAMGSLRGTKIFLRRNAYESGRANIIVYNWDNLTNVAVNASSVLPRNSSFELHNAQDFFAAPVLSGVSKGERLQVPMTNLTVAPVNGPPNGPLAAPPPTGPTFNVFVLRSHRSQL